MNKNEGLNLGTPGPKAGWMRDAVIALQPQPQRSAKVCYLFTDIYNGWTLTTHTHPTTEYCSKDPVDYN